MLHTLVSFQLLVRNIDALETNWVFDFASRRHAGDAASWLRSETTYIVTWVGPQQFFVR